ncbi:hypothetical protein [Roseomonas sp. 18066]|uniref:hypothetical protein n=1 Tax=Roseomonas sp. 18066 TaxID=2681412 RepID=UPI0013579A2C|nr:hypothetical protein [Roseomonas sp. 18066]
MRLARLSVLPALLAGALLLPGCAELRTPRPRIELPLELVQGPEDPVRNSARLAAAAFDNQGAGLDGRPAETARAAARLEYLAQVLTTDPRFAALPPGLSMSLRGAVREVRQAIGISATALPEQVIPALTTAGRVIEARGDTAAALPAAVFQAGPALTLQRLGQPGPLPEAAIATGRTQEAIAALDRVDGWGGVRDTDPLR